MTHELPERGVAAEELTTFINRILANSAGLKRIDREKADIYKRVRALGVSKETFRLLVAKGSKNLSHADLEACLPRAAIEKTDVAKGFSVLGWQNLSSSSCDRSVYFIVSADRTALKVGISKNPCERLAALAASQPYALEMWFFVPGNRQIEIFCHRALSAYRIKGEWFRLCDDVVRIVQALRGSWGLEAIPSLGSCS